VERDRLKKSDLGFLRTRSPVKSRGCAGEGTLLRLRSAWNGGAPDCKGSCPKRGLRKGGSMQLTDLWSRSTGVSVSGQRRLERLAGKVFLFLFR